MGRGNARKACLRVDVMEERIALSSLAHTPGPFMHAAVKDWPSLICLLTPQLGGTNVWMRGGRPADGNCPDWWGDPFSRPTSPLPIRASAPFPSTSP